MSRLTVNEPARTLQVLPQQPQLVPVLLALWAITRYARRYRDWARDNYNRCCYRRAGHFSRQKKELYRLKGQALFHLLADGALAVVKIHRFRDGNWVELVQGGGYSFHRPCPPPCPKPQDAECLDNIEAKPRDAKEPRLADAVFTVEKYLKDKPCVQVYQWPPKERTEPWLDGYGSEPFWGDDHLEADKVGDDPWPEQDVV